MKKAWKELQAEDRVFVGIDLHKKKWYVTARPPEMELFRGSIPGKWEALKRILCSYKGHRLTQYTKSFISVSGCMII